MAFAVLSSVAPSAYAQGTWRWYYKKHVVADTVRAGTEQLTVANLNSVLGIGPKPGEKVVKVLTTTLADGRRVVRRVVANTTVWAGPSLGFDAIVKERETGASSFGVLPGVGYGLKWAKKPKDAKDTPSPFLSIDLFLQGALVDDVKDHDGNDAFNIDVLPVVTVLNWVSVGYGWRDRVGVNGQPSLKRHLFSFGIHKST